jgi:hypothetical protein
MAYYDYEKTLLGYMDALRAQLLARPLNLGGVAAVSGGSTGGTGYIGQLPQTRIAYDLSEAATATTPVSGSSLLDNLNHIRYRLGQVEASGGGGGGGSANLHNIMLIHPGTSTTNYTATAEGLTDALAAAVDGDIVVVPPAPGGAGYYYQGDFTVPAGVHLQGYGNPASYGEVLILGTLSVNEGCVIEGVNFRNGGSSSTLRCAIDASLANSYWTVMDCHVEQLNSGSGRAAAVYNPGSMIAYNCYFDAYDNGGYHWPFLTDDGEGGYTDYKTWTMRLHNCQSNMPIDNPRWQYETNAAWDVETNYDFHASDINGMLYQYHVLPATASGQVLMADDRLRWLPATLPTASGGGHTIQDEGVNLTQRANLNFVGVGVTVTDNAGTNTTTVTISGVASSGGGDMYKATYDADNNGIVDNSERLGGQLPEYYSVSGHAHGDIYYTQTQLQTSGQAQVHYGNLTNVPAAPAASGGGHTIQDEGVSLTQRTKLNFVGPSVTVTDSAGTDTTIVTISGSASSGVSNHNYTHEYLGSDILVVTNLGGVLSEGQHAATIWQNNLVHLPFDLNMATKSGATALGPHEDDVLGWTYTIGAGAWTWKTTSGYMIKTTYDSNANGIVDLAEAVPWTGVTDKPSLFPPTLHNHPVLSGVQYSGVSQTYRPYLNFLGNVILTDDAANNRTLVSVLSGASSSTAGHVIQSGGVSYTQRANLNFTGTGITITDDIANNATVVTFSGGTASSDGKVKVSSNDTTSDYLFSKLVAGSGIAITEVNDGSNETIRLAVNQPRVALLTFGGVLSGVVGPLRLYNVFNQSVVISKIFLAVSTAPNGANLIVDVNHNGSTIFSTQANRPTITAGNFTGESSAINSPVWSSSGYLTADIDQVGSTVPGSNLSVHIVYS